MSEGMNNPLSVEFGDNRRLVHCWCPCGADLGMRDPRDKPTCGDEDCIEYIEKHPGWYEEE